MSVALSVVHVHLRVKPEAQQAFIDATLEHTEHSRAEPGVARFDLVQSLSDPCHFVLMELYRTAGAIDAHKRTSHYAKWRNAVAELLAEPRATAQFECVFPDDFGW